MKGVAMNGLLAVAVLMLLAAGGFAADGVTIESRATSLRIDGATGSITAAIHRPAGREMAAAAAGPLYILELAEPAGRVLSTEASSIRVTQEAGGAVLVVATHEAPAALTVVCRFESDGDADLVVGRISVRSPAPLRMALVTFPVLSLGLPLGGDGSDDRVVMPECDGAVFVDPLKNGLSRDLPYPGTASMQFLSAYDAQNGVYLASRDGAGHSKTLSARRREKTLDLSIRHNVPQTPVTEWSLPYDVALGTYAIRNGEGWEMAADIYRSWALRQSWCAKTLKERVSSGDVPAWLIEPSLFYAFSLHGQLPGGGEGARLALVPKHADAWRKMVGGPVTFMLMGWEKRGPWVAPDYFPPAGDGAFTAATAALHENGHRALLFLSGLNWTLHKTARGQYAAVDEQAAFDGRGRPHAIADASGKPTIYGKPAEDVGQYARICPTTPLAGEMIAGVISQCQEYGLDCVQADQIVGGGSPACFSPAHRHPAGGGNWSAQALFQLFARAREQGKLKRADFAFAIEEPGEFFIPVLDTYHARDYQQNRWPRWGEGVIGVPLFTHVYHDYLHGYGGDSASVSAVQSDVALYHQAMNLVCGKAPAVCAWTNWIDPASVHPTQQSILRSHFELWRGPAREFLIFGKRVTARPAECPSLDITFTDWPSRKQRVLSVPSVLQSTWKTLDGRQGSIFACIAREAVTVTVQGAALRLEPGEAVFRETRR